MRRREKAIQKLQVQCEEEHKAKRFRFCSRHLISFSYSISNFRISSSKYSLRLYYAFFSWF
ncbi:unnamed protein product [Paramecium octaurelia]|uniref:Uncharacterized protein n=1 Tax=Paramecium octaurelia TaxID=43137 RepID=A0A8S1UCL4_PAROT|nr:unnamed protein product [Paramecium octaurelia]